MQRPLKVISVCLSSLDILLLIHSNMSAPLASVLKYLVFYYRHIVWLRRATAWPHVEMNLNNLCLGYFSHCGNKLLRSKALMKGFAGDLYSTMAVKARHGSSTHTVAEVCSCVSLHPSFWVGQESKTRQAASSGPHLPVKLHHSTVLKSPAPPAGAKVLKHIILWSMFYIWTT